MTCGEVNVSVFATLEETKMNLFQRYLAEEFAEDYEEGRISRRDALKLIASVTGSLVAANSILAACAPSPEATGTSVPATTDVPATEALATDSPTTGPAPTDSAAPESLYGTVMPDDPAIIASEVEVGAPDAILLAYLARPANEAPAPIILVCHENRGLTPHIQDVTRRFAKAGYVALAVDLLSRQGAVSWWVKGMCRALWAISRPTNSCRTSRAGGGLSRDSHLQIRIGSA